MLLDPYTELQALNFIMIIGLITLTQCIWVGKDGELLLSPQQVVLGDIIYHIFKGDPRKMVDLINLDGLNLTDPQGRLKSVMTWVSHWY